MDNKKAIRTLMKKKRQALSINDKNNYDKIIQIKLFAILKNYHSIGIFVNFDDEIDTKTIIKFCFSNNIKVSIPKVINDYIIFVTIDSLDKLQLSNKNILEPTSNLENTDMEIMITPLLAYNDKLQRIGYGGGFYDRYFGIHSIYKVGVAYHFMQIQADVFNEYDIPLDYIITN